MTKPDDNARMAQHFETMNRPTVRRDTGERLLNALRPALWLLLAVLVTVVVVHVMTTLVASSAIPTNQPY